MSIHNLLHYFRSALTPGKRPRKTRRRDARRFMANRLQVESLEDRRMLSFVPAANYTAGDQPQVISTGDFNNDGRLDLVTTNQGTDNVTLRLGNADGTFGTAISTPVGDQQRSIAVGDFDDDGNLDLWAVIGDHGVSSLLWGKGDGSFEAPIVGSDNPDTDLLSVAVGYRCRRRMSRTPSISRMASADIGIRRDLWNFDSRIVSVCSPGSTATTSPCRNARTTFRAGVNSGAVRTAIAAI